MHWNDTFLRLFDRCSALYQGGNRDFTSYYGPDDLAFLASIGHQAREFFDFVEDWCDGGDPSPSTALLVAAVRRDWFLAHPGAGAPRQLLTRDNIPTFGEALGGIHYLPRILAKARAKLRGELDPDLMFCCGGDRKFLREHGIHPADFLRRVWQDDGNDPKTASWVGSRAPTS